MKNNITNKEGLIIIGSLAAFFSLLKITGNISWGWLWVFSPIWMPPAAILVIALMIAIVKVIDEEL